MSMPEATILPTSAKYCSRCQRSYEGPGHLCVGCWNITNYEARTSHEKPVSTEPEFKFALAAVDHFSEVTMEQARKGFEKYGKELDPNDPYDWDNMAEQEVVDLWEYIQCAKRKRQQMREELDYLDALNKLLLALLQKERHEKERLQKIVDRVKDHVTDMKGESK